MFSEISTHAVIKGRLKFYMKSVYVANLPLETFNKAITYFKVMREKKVINAKLESSNTRDIEIPAFCFPNQTSELTINSVLFRYMYDMLHTRKP